MPRSRNQWEGKGRSRVFEAFGRAAAAGFAGWVSAVLPTHLMSSSSGSWARPVGQVKGERPAGETTPVSTSVNAGPIIWPPYQITKIAGRVSAGRQVANERCCVRH